MEDRFLNALRSAAELATTSKDGPITNNVDEAEVAEFFESHPQILTFATEHLTRQRRADERTYAPSAKAAEMAHVMALCLSLSAFGVWLQKKGKQ